MNASKEDLDPKDCSYCKVYPSGKSAGFEKAMEEAIKTVAREKDRWKRMGDSAGFYEREER